MYQKFDINLFINKKIELFNTNVNLGLTYDQVEERRKIYALNQFNIHNSQNIWIRFFYQFHHALIYVLLFSAVMSIYLHQWLDAIVICGVVLINAFFGFFQEGKAQKSLGKIREILIPFSVVIRNGKHQSIPSAMLVPGDIVIVNRGDKIHADILLRETSNLQVEESILTGESFPVEKYAYSKSKNNTMPKYYMLFSGTLVHDGRGKGVVIATGKDTEIGQIGTILNQNLSINTPLLKKMGIFSKKLTILIIFIAITILFIEIILRNNINAEVFMSIVSLVVAAVPEGLPPILTIILAIGVTRMAKYNAIIKNLVSVETMGSVSIICTDKTGTLTNNKLIVKSIITANSYCVINDNLNQIIDLYDIMKAIQASILCNEAQLDNKDENIKIIGNPIDIALFQLGLQTNIDINFLKQKFIRLNTIYYETEHKFMATLHNKNSEQYIIYIKGAPEVIIKKCKYQYNNNNIQPIDNIFWNNHLEELTTMGQRVIAIATVNSENKNFNIFSIDDIGDCLIIIALFGFIDPPNENAIAAIKECQLAGIKVKMITGDHVNTAKTVAKAVGIDTQYVLTGEDIDNINDDVLNSIASKISIYARTTPKHKLRLVRALQYHGDIVAMTGDGVNDAPALKQADIGIAMGKSGSDLAKESADMVLTDDNFSTIVNAVKEGRIVFNNVLKVLMFILPTSFAQAFTIITAIIFKQVLPITPLQILWVNMVTAITLSLALGFEKADDDIMKHPPRNPQISLLSYHLIWRIFFISLISVIAIFAMFKFLYDNTNLELSRTIAVNIMIFIEIAYLFNCRNIYNSSINIKTICSSIPVILSISSVILCQLLFIYTPVMQYLFSTQSFMMFYWFYIILIGLFAFIIIEIEKIFLNWIKKFIIFDN